MRRAFRLLHRRARWEASPVLVVCALLLASLAMPALASACPKWSKVKAFSGHADTSFDASVSGSDNNGGTVTVALDRAGSLKIDLTGRIPKSGSGMTEFLGGTSGGILRVGDMYADSTEGTAGGQTGDGPVVKSLQDLAFLVLSSASCTYQLHFSYGVKTTSSGEWPMPPDPGAGGVAVTPAHHIPSSLKLLGTADVPAYYEGCSGSSPHGGCYEFEGLNGGYAWAQEFDMLKTCGSVVASSCGPEGQPEGNATISWGISPAAAPKQKKKKSH